MLNVFIVTVTFNNKQQQLFYSRFPCIRRGWLVTLYSSLLHLSLSFTSYLFNSHSLMSLSTALLHVILGLPHPLLPSTSNDMIFFTQSSSSFHSTCPNHLSLLHCYCIRYNGKLVIPCCMSRHHTEQVHIHQLKECDLLHSCHFLPIMARYCVPLARSGTI